MKKNKIVILVVSTLSILSMFIFFYRWNEAVLAAAPTGTLDLSQAPGINIIDTNKPSTSELSSEYNLKFVISDDLTYVPFGEAKNELFYNTLVGHSYKAKKSRVFKFLNDGSTEEKGVWIYNSAYYNGRKLKVKFVFDDINIKKNPTNGVVPYANFFALDPSEAEVYNDALVNPGQDMYWKEAFLMVGSNGYYESTIYYNNLGDAYTKGDSYSYHYEFYDDVTNEPVDVKGVWSYLNANNAKSVVMDFNGDFDNLAIAKSNNNTYNFGYKLNTPTTDKLSIFSSISTVGGLETRVDNVFSGSNYFTGFALDQSLAGNKWGYPMTMMFYTQSLYRIAPSKPIIVGEKNSSTHKDSDYLDLKYSILVNVADNIKINRNTTLNINSTVPEYYDVDLDSIQIYELGRYDKTYNDLFSIKSGSDNSEVVLTALDPTSDEFNGKYFDIKISAKKNDKFEFAPTKYNYQNSGEDNGYMRFEQGLSSKLYYELKDTASETVVHSNSFDSEITSDSISKVKYEGIPDGDVKDNLNFFKGTTSDEVDVQTAYVDNLRVDTNNDIDKPITVSYKQGYSPDFSVLGRQTIILNLTSAQGVVTEKKVIINITEKEPTIDTIVNVNAVDMETKESVDIYKKIMHFGEISKKVFEYGDIIDISGEEVVKEGKKQMELKGWEYQNEIEQIIGSNKENILETKVETSQEGTIINYLYKAQKGKIIVKFVDEDNNVISDQVSIIARIPDGNIDLTTVDEIEDSLDKLSENNYLVVKHPENEKEIIPKANEDIEVKYVLKKKSTIVDPDDGITPFTPIDPLTNEPKNQNQGSDLLRLQYVSEFEFGKTKRNLLSDKFLLSANDFGVTNDGTSKKIPSFVSIVDDQNQSSGWELSVYSNEFINKNDNETVLKGAYMTLSGTKYNGIATEKPEVVKNKIEIYNVPTLVSYSDGDLAGSWSLALGDLTEDDKSSGVSLTVPKNSVRSIGDYTTNVVWTLTPKIK